MSLIDEKLKLEIDPISKRVKNDMSNYDPTEDEKKTRQLVIRHMGVGYANVSKPRREFSDLSLIERDSVDQMSFNAYQPNNGEAVDGDDINGWKSRAFRPIVRNKTISIAAHATARLMFPKVFAYNRQSDYQQDAATVMRDLMEWAADKSNYAYTSLYATINALVAPASIIYTEYCEVYRTVKRPQGDGTYKLEKMLDETMSGFKDFPVSCTELYIENFYEHDIQKQGWLIWRREQSYDLMKEKYGHLPNFKHVRPGIQLIYNDANTKFYEVYDEGIRGELCEEILYWNRSMDVFLVMVNGVLMTPHDNPNPRNDKLYPFVKFGYELIDGGKFFYYKSLVFKMQQDAAIINTLYPMIIDGTYLSVMPPMINSGSEVIGSDVIVPGAVTTLSSPDADLKPVTLAQNLSAGMNTLFRVDESINKSAPEPHLDRGGRQTAYELSIRDREYSITLGLFVQMISDYVRAYGKLRLGDILQFMTIADVAQITDDNELVYKAFVLHGNQGRGREKTRKIKFDYTVPTKPVSAEEKMDLSYGILEEEGGLDSDTELYKVSPELFRELSYIITVDADVMNPMSEETERAFMLEEYDRAIANPLLDQEQVTKDFLLGAYPKSRNNPDKYFSKNQIGGQDPMEMMKAMMTGGASATGASQLQSPQPAVA